MSLLGPPTWLREAEQQPLCGYRSERPPACTPVALPDSGDRPAALLVVGTEPISTPGSAGGQEGSSVVGRAGTGLGDSSHSCASYQFRYSFLLF